MPTLLLLCCNVTTPSRCLQEINTLACILETSFRERTSSNPKFGFPIIVCIPASNKGGEHDEQGHIFQKLVPKPHLRTITPYRRIMDAQDIFTGCTTWAKISADRPGVNVWCRRCLNPGEPQYCATRNGYSWLAMPNVQRTECLRFRDVRKNTSNANGKNQPKLLKRLMYICVMNAKR